MSVKVEKTGANEVELEITVSAEKFNNEVSRIAKKVAGEVNIPGFRKGKAPRHIIESRVGKDYLWGEAAEALMGPEYNNAVIESGIEPVSRPEADIVQMEAGKEFIYRVKVDVKPVLQLGQYKNLGLTEQEAVVTEEEVEEELRRRQEKHARLQTLEEGTVESGDTVVLDYEGFVGGEAFDGGKAESHELIIGSNTFIPGFEDQMIGMGIGEEKELAVTFPQQYHNADLAGKEAVFRVNTKAIKRKEVVPLDDEFAKDVSEFDTLAEYKEDVRKTLLETAKHRAHNQLQSDIMQMALDNATVEIPESMVEFRIDMMLQDMEQNLRYQRVSLEQYCTFMGVTMDQLREQYREEARKSVKTELLLEAVAVAEVLSVSDEELESSIEAMAKMYGREKHELIKALTGASGDLDSFRQGLLSDKAMELLLRENGVVLPKSPTLAGGIPEEEKADSVQEGTTTLA